MVDRIGIKRTLLVGHLFWCMIPALWLFALPGTAILWVGLGSLVGGVFSIAANNAAVKLATRFPSPEESGMYMAVSTMVGSFAGGLASIAAGAFLHALGDWAFTIFGLAVSGFPLIFIISFALRVTTVVTLLPRVRVRGALPDEEKPFLLPLFFESLPGIRRIGRLQLRARAALSRGRKALPGRAGRPRPDGHRD
jgi:MFS family permease